MVIHGIIDSYMFVGELVQCASFLEHVTSEWYRFTSRSSVVSSKRHLYLNNSVTHYYMYTLTNRPGLARKWTHEVHKRVLDRE